MRTFKAGDRVVVLTDSWAVGIKDKLATVIGYTYACRVEIVVDDWEGGHHGSVGNEGTSSNRWVVREDEIYLVDVDPIIDTRALLPRDAAGRKNIPVGTGFLDYFPAAVVEIAKVSKAGNDQHNPGQPLHWARGKSADHSDTIIRHWLERGTVDTDGQRHSAKLAWRALALLQMELENDGYPKARGAK